MKIGPKPNGFITTWGWWLFWTLFMGTGFLLGVLFFLAIAVPQISQLFGNPPLFANMLFGLLLCGICGAALVGHWNN